MVDPKETIGQTVETETGVDRAGRRVWVKPRLESFSYIVNDTAHGLGNTTADGGGAGHSIS
jgi:hypothetical protein